MELMHMTLLGPSPRLHGFKYWWMKDVVDYDLSVHCARCLRGRYDTRIRKDMHTNDRLLLRTDLVYLCGVSVRGWAQNFHAAARAAPGKSFTVPTFNGFEVRFENAERIEIEPLPNGWSGLPKAFTTCRNFQFAVQMSGANTE